MAARLRRLTCPERRLAGPFYKKYAVTPSAGLRLFVGVWFQVLFHSPPGVLFTVPSRYYALSVAWGV
jgi:hypothetical protein